MTMHPMQECVQRLCNKKYSAAEWIKAKVAIRNVLAPASHLDPARCFKRPTRVVNFLRGDSRCWRYVSDLSSLTPR